MSVAGVIFFLIAAPIVLGIVGCIIAAVVHGVSFLKNDYVRDEEEAEV